MWKLDRLGPFTYCFLSEDSFIACFWSGGIWRKQIQSALSLRSRATTPSYVMGLVFRCLIGIHIFTNCASYSLEWAPCWYLCIVLSSWFLFRTVDSAVATNQSVHIIIYPTVNDNTVAISDHMHRQRLRDNSDFMRWASLNSKVTGKTSSSSLRGPIQQKKSLILKSGIQKWGIQTEEEKVS